MIFFFGIIDGELIITKNIYVCHVPWQYYFKQSTTSTHEYLSDGSYCFVEDCVDPSFS